jgi:hypothetical protein
MGKKSGKAGNAVPPATPEKVEDADIADPGKVAEIKTEQNKTKSGKYGSQQVKPFKPPAEDEAKAVEETKDEKEKEKKTSWIEIELVGEDDEGIPGEKYRITLPDESVAEGTLDEKGFARVAGFTPGGICKVSFPDLDGGAWDDYEAASQAGGVESKSGEKPAQSGAQSETSTQTEPVPDQSDPVGQGGYIVRLGDCISSIAFEYGFFPNDIWNHTNNSKLKQVRKNPNTLMPGDRVHVPEKTLKTLDKADQQRHRFKRKGVPEKLKLKLVKNGRPRANVKYRLEIDGKLIRGKTDNKGCLEHFVPPDAVRGVLIIEPNERRELRLGTLPSVSTHEGLVARLRNLGYIHEGGEVSAEAQSQALASFQQYVGLRPTGEADEQTWQKLIDAHNC